MVAALDYCDYCVYKASGLGSILKLNVVAPGDAFGAGTTSVTLLTLPFYRMMNFKGVYDVVLHAKMRIC